MGKKSGNTDFTALSHSLQKSAEFLGLSSVDNLKQHLESPFIKPFFERFRCSIKGKETQIGKYDLASIFKHIHEEDELANGRLSDSDISAEDLELFSVKDHLG